MTVDVTWFLWVESSIENLCLLLNNLVVEVLRIHATLISDDDQFGPLHVIFDFLQVHVIRILKGSVFERETSFT